MADRPDCKIAVLDVDKEWGHRWGAGTCDLRDPLQWPFAAPGRGIDGADSLAPEAYQYSQEHWLAQVRWRWLALRPAWCPPRAAASPALASNVAGRGRVACLRRRMACLQLQARGASLARAGQRV